MSHANGFARSDHLKRQESVRVILASLESLDGMSDEQYERAVAGLTPEDIERLRDILMKIKEARRRETEG